MTSSNIRNTAMSWMFGLTAVSLMLGVIGMLWAGSGSSLEQAVSREACVVALVFAILIGLLYQYDRRPFRS